MMKDNNGQLTRREMKNTVVHESDFQYITTLSLRKAKKMFLHLCMRTLSEPKSKLVVRLAGKKTKELQGWVFRLCVRTKARTWSGERTRQVNVRGKELSHEFIQFFYISTQLGDITVLVT